MERLPLQKSLILLPSLKFLEELLEGGFLGLCPWYSLDSNAIQYIQMARISIITIAYTLFLAYFYFLCKGGFIVVSAISRNNATNLTMIMGGVYLSYSAYFLSLDFKTIFTVMNIIMTCVYLALAVTYGRNCFANMKRVKAYLTEMGRDENIMRESLEIKYTMLK